MELKGSKTEKNLMAAFAGDVFVFLFGFWFGRGRRRHAERSPTGRSATHYRAKL